MARRAKRTRPAAPAARKRRRGELPLPKRPYRDSAIFHGVLAATLLLVAWATAGDVAKAVVIAVLYFVVATSWAWWRFHQRIAREAATRAASGKAPGRQEAGE